MRLQNTPKLNLFGFRIVFASMKMGQNPENYPLSVRFTIHRKSIYHHVGRDYSQAEYEQIRDAKEGDAHYEERRHWGELMDQYEHLIRETVKGHALTLDVIKSRLNIKAD